MQAMILAAGFGTRLKPYSLIKPKPLFPVLNIPLLRLTIDRLKSSGFHPITVNCHHLRDQIIEEIEPVDGVIIQDEEIILGTGGGLRQALVHLDDEPLLVTNGDIYHSIDFGKIYTQHLKTGADVTMVLHDHPRFNTVSAVENRITGFDGGQKDYCLAYTGIQVINPHILMEIKTGVYSCIIDHYRHLLTSGKGIHNVVAADIFWSDMGTPQDYLALHQALLAGSVPLWPQFGVQPETGLLIDEDCVQGQGCTFEGWNCVGEAHLGDHVHLSRTVVWDEARIPSNSRIKNSIVLPGGIESLQVE